MGKQAFSGIALVALQGDRTLRFVNCTQDRAVYEIIGFENANFTLIDYRKSGLQAIQRVLNTGNLASFASIFNTTSQVDIWESDDGGISIELNDPSDLSSDHVLWIAIGIGNTVPVYDYVVEYYAPLDESRYAFLSVYKLPSSELFSIDNFSSNSASSSIP